MFDALQSTMKQLLEYVDEGGFVMPPLVIGTLVLWYALGLRFFTLRRGAIRSVRTLLRREEQGKHIRPTGIVSSAVRLGYDLSNSYPKDLRRILDDAFSVFDRDLKSGRILIASIVTVAPLAASPSV